MAIGALGQGVEILQTKGKIWKQAGKLKQHQRFMSVGFVKVTNV